MQLFVDNLTVIDCSYLHPEHGIEGESWIVDVALEGELDDQSMIMDFGLVKKRLKAGIDQLVDHKLLVPKQAAQLTQWQEHDAQLSLEWRDAAGRIWSHASPREAVAVLDGRAVDDALIKAHLIEALMREMPQTVARLHLHLRHEAIDGPYYHYSHGLKKHDGNCQRIAHGHRSRLLIWQDGELATAAMQRWCARWKHSYLVSQSDILSQTDQNITSGYYAPQGAFKVTLPRSACHILPEDSTVEQIAHYIARSLKTEQPESDWCVKAYEGVGKGAIAQA